MRDIKKKVSGRRDGLESLREEYIDMITRSPGASAATLSSTKPLPPHRLSGYAAPAGRADDSDSEGEGRGGFGRMLRICDQNHCDQTDMRPK